jgi:hypothetical protein
MATRRTEQTKKTETSDQKMARLVREWNEKHPDKKV